MAPKMLSSRDLAERWNLSVRTVDRWRYVDFGPPFLKIGKTIRYRLEDIIEFEQAAMRESTTLRKLGKPVNVAAGSMVEQAPIQRLTVEDVVAGLRQDLRLGQGQVQAIPEAD